MPEPEHAAEPTSASFLATAKKALAGGIAGAATAVGGGLATAFADGAFSEADAWTVAGLTIGGFAVGFAAVYAAPKNLEK